MHSPQFYPGALCVNSKGDKYYLLISYRRDGHQYERFWSYTFLSEGHVVEIDDWDWRVNDMNVIEVIQ
tara:strand:+ start:605 stop:808 length:204 start_codon:yes stop_codon:yes gene_type:complete